MKIYPLYFIFQEQSENLMKCVVAESKDSLLTYEDIVMILRRRMKMEADLRTIKLMIRYLESQKKASVVFSEPCKLYLVKFAVDSQPVAPITDSEKSVYVLQFKEKILLSELRQFEMEKERLQTEVKELLRNKMRSTVRRLIFVC